ncbi:hypothetical protein ORIO_12655 [Cereibacter azotoformans]|uniref:hypothetical protein n=1 Tax=Cereibacter azotoformans TaxID=43057 RepID=UPI001EE9E325|nr:hypothetical protein [Cereibacter azotoformans]ULB10754.1 hypothetical protein ORIO_12655 [Cereibacter azotoformans]
MTDTHPYFTWLEREIENAEGIAAAVEGGVLWVGDNLHPDDDTRDAIAREYRHRAAALRNILQQGIREI